MTASPAPDLNPAEALRDRVARAMARSHGVDWNQPLTERIGTRDHYRRLAHAALAVLAPAPDSGGEAAVSRVLALAEKHETTARRRETLAARYMDAGRWQLADAFRSLARQARIEGDRIRAAVNGDPS